jgi:hypothetical protein
VTRGPSDSPKYLTVKRYYITVAVKKNSGAKKLVSSWEDARSINLQAKLKLPATAVLDLQSERGSMTLSALEENLVWLAAAFRLNGNVQKWRRSNTIGVSNQIVKYCGNGQDALPQIIDGVE